MSEPEDNKFKSEETNQFLIQNEVDDQLLTNSKYLDFLIGIVALGIINALATWVIIIKFGEKDTQGFVNALILFFTFITTLFINIIAISISNFIIKWKFVKMGVLFVMAYPLLIFGSCTMRIFL